MDVLIGVSTVQFDRDAVILLAVMQLDGGAEVQLDRGANGRFDFSSSFECMALGELGFSTYIPGVTSECCSPP